jgi:tetratricopeptide (TPR) repeat protein
MRVFAHGRLHRFPSRTWERVLAGLGGQRVRRLRDADHLVFGIGAAARPLGQLRADLDEARERCQTVLSERTFLRRLRLLPPLPDEARTFSAADLCARARITSETLGFLVLFDVVEGEAGQFGFRALKAAGEAAKLLPAVGLANLAFAVVQLRDLLTVEEPLSRLQLATDAEGRIALRAGDLLSDLDGQLRLGVGLSGPETAALLSEAETAREAGYTDGAEQLLRRALAGAPKDLDALFELGSLLCETDRFAEGLALLQKATLLRPSFAEAWYNIGHAYERRGRRAEARQGYERAIRADPAYPDPLFNLGMIDLDEARFASAIRRFESYLALDPGSEWSAKARKAIALARLSLVRAAG